MKQLRKSSERGYANHGWLISQHSFSFADYYHPEHMGFRALRVINEDYIAGDRGFPTHPHRDMEILTYVIKGSLEHQDTLGNRTVIKPGEVQRMTAGTGIRHSEANPEKGETHLLQIWIEPSRPGLEPGYEQKDFSQRFKNEKLVLVAEPTGRNGAISINQDAALHAGHFKAGDEIVFEMKPQRHAWVQVISGDLAVDGQTLVEGDGLAISSETMLRLQSQSGSEFLLFDLA